MLRTISVLTNFVRTIISLFIAGMLGVGGWVGYRTYHAHELALEAKDRELEARRVQIVTLSQEVEARGAEIERLSTVVRLVKVDHRVAQLAVIDQWTVAGDGKLMTECKFVEVDGDGLSIGEPHTFTVEGDVVYIDAWVIKFMDEHVEQQDPLRATSVCLFRRGFGEFEEPQNGHPLDPVGVRPAAYSQGSAPGDFERELWSRFWEYANDPAKARQAGVRAAHGEAPSIRLVKGGRYRLELRASGGLTILLDDSASAARGDTL